MPGDARPVVHALQRQVDIFVGFEFDYGETSVVGHGENVDHGAVGRGEGRNLGV